MTKKATPGPISRVNLRLWGNLIGHPFRTCMSSNDARYETLNDLPVHNETRPDEGHPGYEASFVQSDRGLPLSQCLQSSAEFG